MFVDVESPSSDENVTVACHAATVLVFLDQVMQAFRLILRAREIEQKANDALYVGSAAPTAFLPSLRFS